MDEANYRHLFVGTTAPSTRDARQDEAIGAFVARLDARHGNWWFGRFHRPETDLFVGWLTAPEHAFDVVAAFHVECWPVRFHFQLGPARVLPTRREQRSQAETLPLDSLEAATERARAEDLPLELSLMASHLRPYAKAAELLGRNYTGITRRWSVRQHEVVRAMRAAGHAAGAARQLGCTRQTVHRALRSARDTELAATEDALRAWIDLAARDQGLARMRRPAIRPY